MLCDCFNKRNFTSNLLINEPKKKKICKRIYNIYVNSNRMLIFYFFILIPFATTSPVKSGKFRKHQPGNEPFLILGIFSNCNNQKNNKAKIKIFENANVCQKSIDWTHDNIELTMNNTEQYHRTLGTDWFKYYGPVKSWDPTDIKYISFNVCTSSDGVRLASDIILDPRFHVSNHQSGNLPRWMHLYIDNWQRQTRVLSVLMYTDKEVTNSILPVLTHSTILIYQLNEKWEVPLYYGNQYKHNPYNPKWLKVFGTYSYNPSLELARFLRAKKACTFILVVLGKRKANFFKTLRLLKKEAAHPDYKYRYVIERVKVADQKSKKDLIRKLKNDEGIDNICLFGNTKQQIAFFNKAIAMDLANKTWIFQSIELWTKDIKRIPKYTNVVVFYNFKNLDLYYIEQKQPLTELRSYLAEHAAVATNVSSWRRWQISSISTLCSRQMKRLYIAYMKSTDKNSRQFFFPNYQEYLRFYHLFSFPVENIRRSKFLLKMSSDHKQTAALLNKFLFEAIKTDCREPVCGRGYESVYNTVTTATSTESSSKWNYTIGWFCRMCEEGHFQNLTGNGKCRRCPKLMTSDFERIRCYDAYTTVCNNIEKHNVKVSIVISVSGAMLSLLVLCTFYRHRDTPIVRSSDFKTTSFHLALLTVNFLINPFMFLTCPTKVSCTARPLIISWVNCACVAIMFIKSDRIVTVFNSRLRMSAGEMKRLNALYFIQLFLFFSVSSAIAIISLADEPARVVEEFNDSQFIKRLRCNTGSHMNLQTYYLMLLQIFPAVQAFRGRYLPGPFNEAMTIVYITFISITIYAISIPIYYFHGREYSNSTCNWLVSVLTSFIQLVLLYGNKTITILFKQHKNTKDYVRSRIQDNILQDN